MAGRKINNYLPIYITKNLIKKLNQKFKTKKFKILIMGFVFKENCSDMRNTKVENIMYHLTKHGYKVDILMTMQTEMILKKL